MNIMNIYDWVSDQIGSGEPARLFAGHVPVWSEMAVRAAVLRALKSYDEERKLVSEENGSFWPDGLEQAG